jgi:predicted small metal-binding protein
MSGKKPVMGRPKLLLEDVEVSGWDLLDDLIIWSAHESYIAQRLNMSVDTLTLRIKEEHGCTFTEYRDRMKEKIRDNIRAKQFEVAMEGNTQMLVWLGKNECGQSDKQEVQNNQEVTIKIDATDSEL